MTLDDLIAETRTLLDDYSGDTTEQEDLLASDVRITRLLNEGQDKFCALSGHIYDTEESLSLVVDQDSYTLPDYVLAVLGVEVDGLILAHLRYRKQGSHTLPRNRAASADLYSASGTVVGFRTDVGYKKIKILPAPSSDTTATLRVWRKAKQPMADSGHTPEIPTEYHVALAHYAVSRIFLVADADVSDARLARDNYRIFLAAAAEAKSTLAISQGLGVGFESPRSWAFV